MLFDWDNANIAKCQKHGVRIEEIEYVLLNGPVIITDPYPSEDRRRAIGRNNIGRFVFVVFTSRVVDGRIAIRPISARYMHQKEFKKYL